MLRDAALLQLDLLERSPRRVADGEGQLAVQRAVARRRAGVHRRRLLRTPARGRAVGRLPAVLHAVPLSADASGVHRRPVPAVAARRARRDRAARGARGVLSRARPAAPRRADERASCTPDWSAATPRSRDARCERELRSRRLQRRDHPGQRAAHAQARRAGCAGSPARPAWTDYREDDGYREADARRQGGLRRARPRRRRRRLAWDLGANDGAYARIAAESADCVLAMDVDHPTVERLYRTLRDERRAPHPAARHGRLRPLAGAAAGAGASARSLTERGRPDLTLCLALVHHLAITRNVPLARDRRLAGRASAERSSSSSPTRERPDGAATAGRQARGRARRLRAANIRALLARGVRRRPPRSSCRPAARPVRGVAARCMSAAAARPKRRS